jgi:peptidyl-prolyl cis-trans isomerase C
MGLIWRFWRPAALAAAVLLATGVGLTACQGGRKGSGDGKPSLNPIVAVMVNGEPIYISDVEAEAITRRIIAPGEDLVIGSDAFERILDELIDERLLADEAEQRSLDKSADVRHSLERARAAILAGAVTEQIRQTALDESNVERMYRDQTKLLRGKEREVHARQIVVLTRDAAIAAKRRLESGDSFEAVAYDVSIDRRTGAEGGDMGFLVPTSAPTPMQPALTDTPVGKVSDPVQTAEGWRLIKIDERRDPAPPSLESMRPQIERYLLWDEVQKLLEKLRKKGKIERLVDPPELASPTAPVKQKPNAVSTQLEGPVPMGPGGLASAAGADLIGPDGAQPPSVAAQPAPAPAAAKKRAPRPADAAATPPPTPTAPPPTAPTPPSSDAPVATTPPERGM